MSPPRLTQPSDLPTSRRLLITLGFPPAVGGIQRLLNQRCLMQPEEMAVLAPTVTGWRAFDGRQPFPVQRWPGWMGDVPGVRRMWQLLLPLQQAIRWQRTQPFSAIECGQTLPFGVAGWLLARRWQIPYDVWTYGDDVLKASRNPVLRMLARFVLRRARRVWAVSQATRLVVLSLGVPEEQVQVAHPWPTASFFTAPIAPQPARDGATLLTVARLEERKGVQAILQAMLRVRIIAPEARLIIVGDGRQRDALEHLARRWRLTDNVAFVGQISDDELAAWYRRASVFVFAPQPDGARGEMEGFGLVCVEAAAAGCPVVAWKTGGVGEAVRDGETGLLVEAGSVRSLAEAIVHLLQSPAESARLGEGGMQYASALARQAAARFSGDQVTDTPEHSVA